MYNSAAPVSAAFILISCGLHSGKLDESEIGQALIICISSFSLVDLYQANLKYFRHPLTGMSALSRGGNWHNTLLLSDGTVDEGRVVTCEHCFACRILCWCCCPGILHFGAAVQSTVAWGAWLIIFVIASVISMGIAPTVTTVIAPQIWKRMVVPPLGNLGSNLVDVENVIEMLFHIWPKRSIIKFLVWFSKFFCGTIQFIL